MDHPEDHPEFDLASPPEVPWFNWLLGGVAITGLIGLMCIVALPRIKAIREAQRREQCRQNLRALGLALHNYADQNSTSLSTPADLPTLEPELDSPEK